MLIRCKFLFSKWMLTRKHVSRKFGHWTRISMSKSLSTRGLLFMSPVSKKILEFPPPILQNANYISSTQDDDTIIPEYDDDSIDFAVPNSFLNDSLRQKLYPDTTDSILLSLTEANSVQEIYSILEGKELNEEHVSQAIVSLWDLQKFLHHFPPNLLKGLIDVPVAPSFKINRKILGEFIEV